MEREIWEIVKALDEKKLTAIEAHKKLLIIHSVAVNEAIPNNKEHQKKLLREIMQGDEELGLYSEVKYCECLPPIVRMGSAFLVQHKETLINYGLFSTREKAENYINKNTDLFGIQEVKIA